MERLRVFSEGAVIVIKQYCAIAGGLWTIMEILSRVFSDFTNIQKLAEDGLLCVDVSLVLTVIWCIHVAVLKSKIGTKTVQIKYRNIMKCYNGSVVVGINNQSISDMDVIGRDSIHAQLIKKAGGNIVQNAIRENAGKIIKPVLRNNQTPGNQMQDFVLLRMADINEHGVANTSSSQIIEALRYLFWHQDEYDIMNHTLYIPLLGTGTASAAISRKEVVEAILREYAYFQNNRQQHRDSIEKLVIVIRKRDVNYVNPIVASKSMKKVIDHCASCDMIPD